jgi:hypothetical protein
MWGPLQHHLPDDAVRRTWTSIEVVELVDDSVHVVNRDRQVAVFDLCLGQQQVVAPSVLDLLVGAPEFGTDDVFCTVEVGQGHIDDDRQIRDLARDDLSRQD